MTTGFSAHGPHRTSRRKWISVSFLSAVLLVVAMISGAGLLHSGHASASATPSLLPASGQYFPTDPVKVLDTRDGTGDVSGALAPGATASFPVTGVGAVPDAGVADVYVIISAIAPTDNGCLDDYDTDTADPGICTVSFDAGNNASDSDIVQVSGDGEISVTNTSPGTADVAVSVMGYYTDVKTQDAGDTYASLPGKDILDTRTGLGAPQAQIPGGGSLTVQVTGHGGVPSGAVGAALYIGAAGASTTGWVSAYPAGGTATSVSMLSYVPNQAVRDLYFGALSASGQFTLVNNGSAPVDLMVGVQGYLAGPSAAAAGSTYADVPELRIVDTRQGVGVAQAQVPSGGSITFNATGVDGVPQTGVSATAESIRAMNATAAGYLTVYAGGTADPNSPAVNFYNSGNQDNGLTAALVSVGATGQQTITNHSPGPVDVVVSIRGYYASPDVPDAPDDVSVDLEGTAATVSWQPPPVDGGSPVTGYTVTAPPDSAAVTVDSGTSQVILTGLVNGDIDDFQVTANNAVSPGPAGDVEYGTDQTNSMALEQNVGISYNEDSDATQVIDNSGQVTSVDGNGVPTVTTYTPDVSTITAPPADPPAGSLHGCNVNVNTGNIHYQNLGLFTNHHDLSGIASMDWLNYLYGLKNAKKIRSAFQWEGMVCTAGNAVALGNFRASLSENAIVTNSTSANTLYNFTIRTKTNSGHSVTRSLDFSLNGAFKDLTLGVQAQQSVTTVESKSETGGSFGVSDGHYGNDWPAFLNQYEATRVNTFWRALNSDGRVGGGDGVGSVALALYMYPESQSRSSHEFYSVAEFRGCDPKLAGDPCASLDHHRTSTPG